MLEIDRWAVSKAHSLLKNVSSFYESFQFHKAHHALYRFCVVEMSNFYLDILKDRLYTFTSDSKERRSCQSAMLEVLKVLVTSAAPVMVFTAEEIWQNMPREKSAPLSIHLNLWPDTSNLSINRELEARWHKVMQIRNSVLKVLEYKRSSGIIGSSLEAKVVIYTTSDELFNFIKHFENELNTIFIVSQAELKKGKAPDGSYNSDKLPEMSIAVSKAEGKKCSRCWNFSVSTGSIKGHLDICKRCADVIDAMKGE